MKKLLLIFFMAPITMFSQAIIWEEDFNSYTADYTGVRGPFPVENNGYAPGAVPEWDLDASRLILTSATNDYFYVNLTSGGDGELYARDIDGDAVFTTENIDITSGSGNVVINIGKIRFDVLGPNISFNGSEFIDVYYSLDGGVNYTLIPYQAGSETGAGHTFANANAVAGEDFDTALSFQLDPGTATAIKLQIVLNCDGANERIILDDISVERDGIPVWSEDFNSVPSDNYGYIGSLGAVENSGDYLSAATKWTLSHASTLDDQFDYAAVRTSTGRFVFNDIDDVVTFETETIDITGVTNLTFSMDLTFGNSYDGTEYFDVYYSIDGGINYTLVGTGHTYDTTGSIINNTTVAFSHTISGLSATDFRIRIEALNESNVEDFIIDNIIVINDNVAGVDDVFEASVSLYPNPLSNNQKLYISSPIQGEKSVALFDITGKEIHKVETTSKNIDLPNVKSGLYLIRIEQENKIATKRLIIR